MNKLALTLSVIAILLAGSAYVFIKPVNTAVNNTLGASGNTFSGRVAFFDNTITGGNTLATTSQGSVTYTATTFANARNIEHIASAATTATLPTAAALSSAGYLPNVGDSQTVLIHASTTKITLAAGTGITLHSASSTKDVAAGSIGALTCTRLGATEGKGIWCLLTAD